MSEESIETQELAAAASLLGVVVHSFNNILQGITTSLDLAATSNSSAQCTEYLDHAAVLVAEAALLAHRVLNWISESRTQYDTCDLGPLVRAAAAQFDSRLPIDVKLTTAVETDALVRGCPRELSLLVSLLVANAVEALAGRGGHIHVVVRSAPATSPTSAAAAAMIELAVRDDGPGMTVDVRAHCLEPFFTTHAERGASGLGLPIAQGIARRHAGRLALDSVEELGTRVSVLIPRA